ncbi:hypothetical protein F2P56_002422 [Juglans regia]|uniref:Uncharacterized protein n=1 Tax=Juglans regia TaxID=51240 RepID=A0A833Y1I9_JUGRE|nr:hypothetical protein F2P56_002422 [Juglans regia]
MKSVSMAKFTLQEIEALQNDGNQRAPELFDKKPGKTLADGDLINSEYLKWGNEAKELGGTLSALHFPLVTLGGGPWKNLTIEFAENIKGVAFSKHLIHLHSYNGSIDRRQLSESDAHVGGVNDLAFSHSNNQLCGVTGGVDKLIKVWDLSGRRLFNLESHEAPVYSIFPHQKENIQFIILTVVDRKIKAWLYDHMGSRVDYDAPAQGCTRMLYSADGSILFSCGTSKDGDSFLVEWNETE